MALGTVMTGPELPPDSQIAYMGEPLSEGAQATPGRIHVGGTEAPPTAGGGASQESGFQPWSSLQVRHSLTQGRATSGLWTHRNGEMISVCHGGC